MSTKIAIIGTGRVGATIAYTLIIKNLASTIIMVDSNVERCEGEVRDIADVLAFSETAHIEQGTCKEACDADIVIIAAGFAQQGPHETRRELAAKNRGIIESIMRNIGPLVPTACIIVVTNPVDLMTMAALASSKRPATKVFGSGTWLDTQRLRRYLGLELGVSPHSLDAFVIGEHGDAQLVPWEHAHIGGLNMAKSGIPQETLDAIAKKTAYEAYAIIEKKCATYYGIAACVADMCETIIFDQKKVMPVSCFIPDLGVCLSMPVVLGKEGIERNLMVPLSQEEHAKISTSAALLKSLFEATAPQPLHSNQGNS